MFSSPEAFSISPHLSFYPVFFSFSYSFFLSIISFPVYLSGSFQIFFSSFLFFFFLFFNLLMTFSPFPHLASYLILFFFCRHFNFQPISSPCLLSSPFFFCPSLRLSAHLLILPLIYHFFSVSHFDFQPISSSYLLSNPFFFVHHFDFQPVSSSFLLSCLSCPVYFSLFVLPFSPLFSYLVFSSLFLIVYSPFFSSFLLSCLSFLAYFSLSVLPFSTLFSYPVFLFRSISLVLSSLLLIFTPL